ncbi:MAG: TIGR01459 family HAD-type hydrolase [Stappiaceae bacterium]
MTDTSSLFVSGLSALAPSYSGILCDVWGVVHNGVSAFQPAHEALAAYRKETGGSVVLITNAPRPSAPIYEQLDRLGVPREAYDCVVTSGDVTHTMLSRDKAQKAFHIGPDRDLPLFDGTGVALSGPDEADIIVCTGLFDDTNETPDDYRDRLTTLVKGGKRFICANPDIIVERGDTLIWCAGALARLYEDLGGEIAILGKPHKPIYDLAIEKLTEIRGSTAEKSDILAIGDGLPTDIRGAYAQGLDVLFITGGIHAADFGETLSPDEKLVRARLAEEGFAARAALPHLTW